MYGLGSSTNLNGDIINLNVGGTRFSTSRQTLTSFPDTFFTSLLSGRISSLKDDRGAIFIDRDPKIFAVILGYLRSKEIDVSGTDLHILRHEAEFYGISPLVRRLQLCEELSQTTCGGVLFHGVIAAPVPPFPSSCDEADKRKSLNSIDIELTARTGLSAAVESLRGNRGLDSACSPVSLTDLRFNRNGAILTGSVCNTESPLRVTIIKGHFNWLAVAYPHFVSLYRLKESIGWNLAWVSPYIEAVIEHIALNAKVITPGHDSCSRMLAVNHSSYIQLWQISDNGQSTREVGTFNLSASIDSMFFIGCHLVALGNSGKFGVWHAMTQNWQIQDVGPITSYDTTGSFLLLGCDNGSIYNIDMQKFPLRMKDNDLLVTELYKDPTGDKITSLSVYITPKSNQQYVGFSGNWIEIAYGTNTGMLRIIVQHPETLGQGPQLFQTFAVHCSPVTKVMISEKHLVSVCSEYNHVRTWSVTRFRGMISTQPGSMPLASFKVLSVEDASPPLFYATGNDIGPYGEKDDQQVFIQKVVPNSDQLFVRLSCSGKRICVIRSVDGTVITSFTTHECEGSTRMGSRPRRYLFSGHSNGTVQIWDLSTALDMNSKGTVYVEDREPGGPTANELLHLVDQCELSGSNFNTPSVSPSPHLILSAQPSARSSVCCTEVTGQYGSQAGYSGQAWRGGASERTDQTGYGRQAEGGGGGGGASGSNTPGGFSPAIQNTPQLLRRRFLEERSHISPLGHGTNVGGASTDNNSAATAASHSSDSPGRL